VYFFHNDGDPEVMCASADWMPRNLVQRVEQCFPVEDKKLKRRVIDDLELYLRDNTQAWVMQSDGTYVRSPLPSNHRPISAQQNLLDDLAQ
jgi:polyphosphate kinase